MKAESEMIQEFKKMHVCMETGVLEACGDNVLIHPQLSWGSLASKKAPKPSSKINLYFFKSQSISYQQGRRQRYLMACFSFTLALAYGTKRKRAISRHLESSFQSGTDCLEPFPDCLPSIALEQSSSTDVGSWKTWWVAEKWCSDAFMGIFAA